MQIKQAFPIFSQRPELVYLDSTATTLKPQVVLDKLQEYYTRYSANIHRGLYSISEAATQEYEDARVKIASFIKADRSEIVFTRGATEGINLLTHCLDDLLNTNDEIVVSLAEHHSNFVPWQQLAKRRQCKFNVIPLDDNLNISHLYYSEIITPNTKILAITGASNVTGNITDLYKFSQISRQTNPNIIIIADLAQVVAHRPVNINSLDIDFAVFSGHKLFGPTGVGVLWGKAELLNRLKPYHYGGEMVTSVTITESFFKSAPLRFEAGTPPIAQAIALGQAVDFLQQLSWEEISAHEDKLNKYCRNKLKSELGNQITILPNSDDNVGIVTFDIVGAHPHDVAQILAESDVCVRAGLHCAQPLHDMFGLTATIRASFSIYNNECDVDKLVAGCKKAVEILKA